MTDVEKMRAAFFRKTRRMAVLLYVCLGLTSVILAAVALGLDTVDGMLGLVIGLAIGLTLFAVSPLIPVSAGRARSLVYLAPVAGVVAGQWLDVGDFGSDAFFAGAFGGFLAGTVAGIAAIRRKLVHDDELLLRQKRLGFDPEHPSRWLRD